MAGIFASQVQMYTSHHDGGVSAGKSRPGVCQSILLTDMLEEKKGYVYFESNILTL